MILDAMNSLSVNPLFNSQSMYLERQSNGEALEGFQHYVDVALSQKKRLVKIEFKCGACLELVVLAQI